jgi:DNA-directed RNA polymerase beta' subunit
MIPAEWGDNKPTATTVHGWIKSERFQNQAESLDRSVADEIEARMVKEKVEMLKRHADVGFEIQNMAIDEIRKKKDDLSSNALVRLLIEGIRIERESRGVPQAIEKMVSKTDEELLEEVRKLTGGAEVEILDD